MAINQSKKLPNTAINCMHFCVRTLQKPLCIVLGNESCDLDSAVSAITLAFFHSRNENRPYQMRNYEFMPMLNINRSDLKLKTEVLYFFGLHGIDSDNVLCKDEIPAGRLNGSCHILVDHHVSPYRQTVKQVFDHRPLDKRSHFTDDCIVRIEEVGSCATLIADYILQSEHTLDRDDELQVLSLLYAPIVLDTINFDPVKTKPLDILVTDKIVQLLNTTDDDRKQLFRGLQAAQFGVDSLTAYDLLARDLKVITDPTGQHRIPIASMPITVRQFMQMPDIVNGVTDFHRKHNSLMSIVLGRELVDDKIQRDFLVVNCDSGSTRPLDTIVSRLIAEPSLEIGTVRPVSVAACSAKMGALTMKISRKQILPIVQKYLDELFDAASNNRNNNAM